MLNVIYFILLVFIIWRLGLFIISWVGSIFFPFTPSFPYSESLLVKSGLPPWIWTFANFDGVHYISIAKVGYAYQFTQVFFPLYPVILGIINNLVPYINLILSGLLISNLSFIASLIVFSKLLHLDYKKDISIWAILFLLAFPTSFFFGSLYTEGFFFLLLISSFYFARIKKWWLAGLLGALASATRLIGIFLLPALLWEWHHKNFKFQISNFKFRNILNFIFLTLQSPIFYLVPLGLISYMIYLQIAFNDALYFWHAQPVFGAERSGTSFIFLPQVIWRYTKILLSVSFSKHEFWVAFSELSFSLFAIILLIVATIKKLRISYLIFSWLAVIIPTFSGTFSSMPRYVAIAFPIYIILAMIKNKIFKLILLLFSLVLLTIFTSIFTRGIWIS